MADSIEAAEAKTKRVQALLLAIGMLITGTFNTIFLKFQDHRQFYLEGDEWKSCEPSKGCKCDLLECYAFSQPVFQTFIMFCGELMCLVAFYVLLYFRKRAAAKSGELLTDTSTLVGKYRFLLWIPALCDMTATTLMNAGLILTYTSVFQMLRGAVIVFTGIFSVIFLKRKQYAFHWTGIFFVVTGIVIVGLASVLPSEAGDIPPAEDPVLGAILIVCAQVFTATQFVVEEKILGRFDAPPMLAIGLEGAFGVATLAVLMPIFQKTLTESDGGPTFFDVAFAFGRFVDTPSITVSSIGCILSISFFNFFGLSITKVMSATSRSTIDAMRTLLVWAFSLAFKWESFIWLQAIGFPILVFGTFMYNEVFRLPIKQCYPAASAVDAERKEDPEEARALLGNDQTKTSVNSDYY